MFSKACTDIRYPECYCYAVVFSSYQLYSRYINSSLQNCISPLLTHCTCHIAVDIELSDSLIIKLCLPRLITTHTNSNKYNTKWESLHTLNFIVTKRHMPSIEFYRYIHSIVYNILRWVWLSIICLPTTKIHPNSIYVSWQIHPACPYECVCITKLVCGLSIHGLPAYIIIDCRRALSVQLSTVIYLNSKITDKLNLQHHFGYIIK